MPRWEAFVLVFSVMAMGSWWGAKAWDATRTGTIAVITVPVDASVQIDGVNVPRNFHAKIEELPGEYTLSVTRDGYARHDQVVNVRPGAVIALNVKLEPSPETGFELTSDPPGGLVWLDGVPLSTFPGVQARTNFRALRIEPGHHVLEIRADGAARFKRWMQDIEIEPGSIRKISAVLIPEREDRGPCR